MPMPKQVRIETIRKHRDSVKKTNYTDWLGRPVTKLQYLALKKKGLEGEVKHE